MFDRQSRGCCQPESSEIEPNSKPLRHPESFEISVQRYFLKVLEVIATVKANNAEKGKTIKVGCRLNGEAKYTTQVITTRGSAVFLA